jgi:nitrate reductase gamma subunit
MDGIIFLLLMVWASYLFIAGTYTYRSIKYALMPVHLRWELYPVPHEEGNKYGGSYLEELEWWTKPRKKSFVKDILYIAKDYLTFFQYFKLNRAYWAVIYVWHVGFYLIVAFHGLVAIGALAMIGGVHEIAAGTGNAGITFFYYLTLVTGVAGFSLGCLGSIGVLIRRLMDPDLNLFASPKNFFSYIFYFFVFLSGLIAWAAFDTSFVLYREFYHAVFTLDMAVVVDAALVSHAVLFALFLFYMPTTQAMHYATKFFAYFAVRWNDGPNIKGSKVESKLQQLLKQPVTWSAPHIQTGGDWVEVCTNVVDPKEAE